MGLAKFHPTGRIIGTPMREFRNTATAGVATGHTDASFSRPRKPGAFGFPGALGFSLHTIGRMFRAIYRLACPVPTRQLFAACGGTTPGQSHSPSLHAAGRLESSMEDAGGHGLARRPYRIDYRNILSHREAIALGLKARTA